MANELIPYTISSGKTWFTFDFSSVPENGRVDYRCTEDFFNRSEGVLYYTGATVVGDTDLYVSENTGQNPRYGTFELTARTNTSEEYPTFDEVTCGWTITQLGTEPGPPPIPEFEFSAVQSKIAANDTLIKYGIKSNEATIVSCSNGEFAAHQPSPDKFITSGFTVLANETTNPVTYTMTARTSDTHEEKTATVKQMGKVTPVESIDITLDRDTIPASGPDDERRVFYEVNVVPAGTPIKVTCNTCEGESEQGTLAGHFDFSENTDDEQLTHFITASFANNPSRSQTAKVTQYAADGGTPLTFEITGNGVIKWKTTDSNEFVCTIKYSKNGGQWKDITSTAAGAEIQVESGDIVQFKGDNERYGYNSTTIYTSFSGTTCQFNVKGNIMSLIRSQSYETITSFPGNPTRVFYCLFRNCTGLTDASELNLPILSLVDYCYAGMFAGCTSLTGAPTLPALGMRQGSYQSMFAGCTSLIDAPAINGETLAGHCYESMFEGCTSLTGAPVLSATMLAYDCYNSMFAGCTNLTNAPALTAATTLAEDCYKFMFEGCTSLYEAPVLTARTLAWGCYYGMFMGCTSLYEAPELPATTLAHSCYCNMFAGCTNLTDAPALTAATTLVDYCYCGMFYNCIRLNQAPLLPATKLAPHCYDGMFCGCTSLSDAPALTAATLVDGCYQGMFSACTSLTTAPALPATRLANSCYCYMFGGCTGLTSAPELTAATEMAAWCYYRMFVDCTSLTGAPQLTATILDRCCYGSMFEGCTGLTEAPALPATELAQSCYYGMFSGCTSLGTAPELPAATLVNSCYERMFAWCVNLHYIKCKATNISADSCTKNWVYRTGVGGDFVIYETAEAAWLRKPRHDGIPIEDWEVKYI